MGGKPAQAAALSRVFRRSIGWIYGRTGAFSAHAIVRVLSAVALWYAFPDHRFSLVPLSTGVVYAATFFYLMRDVKREAARERPAY